MVNINTINATAIVITAWIVTFCVIAGLGQFVRKAFRADSAGIDSWFGAFWIGYAVLIAALHWWHFFLPIDWRISVVLAVVGLAGFIWGIRSVRLARRDMLIAMLTVLLLAPVALWLALRALNAQLDFDSAFYHINYIRWLNEYPVVVGLGNLHYRLAFNQSLFMFVAALNVFPYFNEGYHIANSLLLITLIAQAVVSWIRLLFKPRTTQPASLFTIFTLPVLLYRASHQPYSANISSPSPDLSVFVLMIIVTILFVRYLTEPEITANEQRLTLFSIVAISAVGITSKLSFAAFGATMIILAPLLWIVRHRDTYQSAIRQALIWLAAAGILIGLPWVMHGIITSGYPVFPATFGALPVDWKVPTSITIEARDWIYSFARQRSNDMYAVLGSWDWLKSWLRSIQGQFSSYLVVVPAVAFIVELPLCLIAWFVTKKRYHTHWQLWLPLLPALISGLFWFLTAPDPRFAGSAFWLLALWTLTALIVVINLSSRWFVNSLLLMVGVISIGIFVAIFPDHLKTNVRGFPQIPKASMEPYKTDSGLTVYVPANGSLQLWDSPLPSSPYKLPNLALRGTDLHDGFRMQSEE